jgi:putative copper export protein
MVPLEAIVSGMVYVVSALLLGVLVTAGFILKGGESEELRRGLTAAALKLIVIFLVIAVIWLLVQGAKFRQGELPSGDILIRYVTMTQSGKVWLLSEVYAVSLVVIILWLLRSEARTNYVKLVFFLALPLVVGRSFTSHAMAVRDNTSIAVASDAAHIIATGLWGGGLLALFWVLYRSTKKMALPLSWAAATVRRFSRLALGSVPIVFLSGLYQSWIQVGNLSTLFGTAYGRVLAVKLGIFVAMIGLGALNFLSTGPRLLSASQPNAEESLAARSALTRIGTESFLALLVFFVTGLLTVLPPGVHAVHQAALAKVSTNNTTDGPPPAQPRSAEGASVKILLPTKGQVFTSDQVPLRFNLTRGKRGDHVHAYIDGELIGMFMSQQGTLNGIKPGRHVLELRVVAEDHQTELDATDRTDFIVK